MIRGSRFPDSAAPIAFRRLLLVRMQTAMVGAGACFVAACGALIGVTDPELRSDAGNGTAGGKDAASDPDAATSCGKDLRTDPKNCGSCAHDCGGKTCNDGVCEGDDTSKPLGDIRQIVAGGESIYVAQSDGIYWSTKKSEFVSGELISDIKNARLSVDPTNLYAVGQRGSDTVVAACKRPCITSGNWQDLASKDIASAGATSVVVAHGQPFLVGRNKLWKLNTSSLALEDNWEADVDENQGSRVHADDVCLYGTGVTNNSIYLFGVDGTSPFHTSDETWNCSASDIPCNAGVTDVLVLNAEKVFGNANDKYSALSVVANSTKMLARCYTSGCSAEALGIEGIKELVLAGNGNSNSFYARALDRIHLCSALVPNGPYGVTVRCDKTVVSSPNPIVSMTVDGNALYYATVTALTGGKKRGTVALVRTP